MTTTPAPEHFHATAPILEAPRYPSVVPQTTERAIKQIFASEMDFWKHVGDELMGKIPSRTPMSVVAV